MPTDDEVLAEVAREAAAFKLWQAGVPGAIAGGVTVQRVTGSNGIVLDNADTEEESA